MIEKEKYRQNKLLNERRGIIGVHVSLFLISSYISIILYDVISYIMIHSSTIASSNFLLRIRERRIAI